MTKVIGMIESHFMSGRVTLPVSRGLFQFDDTATQLSTHGSNLFHSIFAKLLYISQRGRPDIGLALSFLCTRVSRRTGQDWSKLKRLLQYLHDTIDLVQTLGAHDKSTSKMRVDASYAVHEDMKSHTGGAIFLGIGAFICKSTKQKLVTKSSMEAEVVAASDYLPNTIWWLMFLDAQGHIVNDKIFNQDNQSAMHLATNGRASARPKSRHIDIRHFFVTGRIKTEKLSLQHCPTDKMLANFFTKPIQGALFRKF